jgi:type I restriction enzyme S subunit
MSGFVGPIKDIALGIYDGPHATPVEADSGPVYLGIKNVTAGGRLDLSEIRHVSEQDFPKWIRRVTPQADDIVFSYEATLHRYALIPDGFRGCLGRRMALVRPDPTKVVPKFLHYYFLSSQWRSVVEANIISGATVDRIPIMRFPSFEVRLPDINAQRRIVSVLSAYDDLIENNRRRIQLLEQAARLIFKEWFVHLRFPGHEHVAVSDGVPAGWERKMLGDLCDETRETVLPESLEPDTPYIGLEHMPRRSITLNEWGKSKEVTSTKHRFRDGDILFGKIRPYFHKVGIALISGVASSDAIIIRPLNDELLPFVLMTVSSDSFVAMTSQTMKEGSKMPRADWKQMQSFVVALPPEGLLSSFDSLIAPIVQQLKVLSSANQRLRKARELLLPRLMNGEIAL